MANHLGRAALRALLLFGISAALPLQAETARDGRKAVEGLWGFELAPDMTCAVNPVQIDYAEGTEQLVFTWPKSVTYSDGSVSDGVTFTVVAVDGLALSLRRDRDGVMSSIVVSSDGKSFQYEEDSPGDGSRFDRCEGLSS